VLWLRRSCSREKTFEFRDNELVAHPNMIPDTLILFPETISSGDINKWIYFGALMPSPGRPGRPDRSDAKSAQTISRFAGAASGWFCELVTFWSKSKEWATLGKGWPTVHPALAHLRLGGGWATTSTLLRFAKSDLVVPAHDFAIVRSFP
jgi:hypothetical protein